ncbi:Cell division cycle-associated 7-like protein, partial [Linum grandiflorum]
ISKISSSCHLLIGATTTNLCSRHFQPHSGSLFKSHFPTHFTLFRSNFTAAEEKERTMVSTRKRRAAAAGEEAVGASPSPIPSPDQPPAYEDLREQRIKENKERLEKLGLLDLSLKLKSTANKKSSKRNNAPSATTTTTKSRTIPSGSESPRRSSRVKTLAPVNYTEMVAKKKRGPRKDLEIRLQEGTQPEVYTEEHDKLLGSCDEEWVLGVDGYSVDGKRLLDPVDGKTCHQCRYGENVTEVNQNPDWICPTCRGICNCSLCRKEKGWLPTGNLYRKVTKLGFKSVAHYLIQTYRAKQENSPAPAEELAPKLLDASESQLGVSDADGKVGTEDVDVSLGDHDAVDEVK